MITAAPSSTQHPQAGVRFDRQPSVPALVFGEPAENACLERAAPHCAVAAVWRTLKLRWLIAPYRPRYSADVQWPYTRLPGRRARL